MNDADEDWDAGGYYSYEDSSEYDEPNYSTDDDDKDLKCFAQNCCLNNIIKQILLQLQRFMNRGYA